jgi:ABC-type sugar transport system, periplasmic component
MMTACGTMKALAPGRRFAVALVTDDFYSEESNGVLRKIEMEESMMKKGTLLKATSMVAVLSMVVTMSSGFAVKNSVAVKPKAAKSTITVLASQDWIRDPEKTLAKKFQQKTGITVDYQIVPSGQYQSVLSTKLNAGECADIFMTQSGKFDIASTYNITKNAVDLSKESWVSREDSNVRDQASVNGKLYGLTIWDTAPIYPVIYNKVLFKKYNLPIPKTYAQFKTDCAKLLAGGVTPVYEPGADGWHLALWFLDIGPIYESKTASLVTKLNLNKAKFTGNAEMTKALTELQQLVKLGYFGKNLLSQNFSDTEKNMSTGQYAMTLDGLGTPNTIAKVAGTKYKATDFGFFEVPICDNNILDYGTAAPTKYIYSGSKNKTQAKQFFDYLTQTANLQYYLNNDPTKVSLCFSGVKDTMTAAARTFVNSYKKKGVYMQMRVKYVNPQWAEIDKDLQALYTNAETPAQVLQNIDSRRTQQAKAAKDSSWK